MSYWIFVFNEKPVENINPEGVIKAVTRSNFDTLCQQYDLDPGLIQSALENMEIIQRDGTSSLAFMLRYRPKGHCPLRIYRWGIGEEVGGALLSEALDETALVPIRKDLSKATQIIGIELRKGQLRDLGLLLAHELARWAADRGSGILRGLDGIWYRLNRHAAFIPLHK